MNLSKFTDYALRVLIYLSGKDEDLATIDEISNTYGISKEHLRKIIHHLSKEGWIESRRGRGGGMKLAKQPKDISIGLVIRGTEEGFNVAECFDPQNKGCYINGVCRLKGLFGEALDAFLSVLDKYTLDDITHNQNLLFKRLGLTDLPQGVDHATQTPN